MAEETGETVKYDDASWHSEGKFPEGLPPEAAATHTGLFVAWALLHGLGSDERLDDSPDDVAALRARTTTPGALFLASFDGKLLSGDLNPTGNAFTAAYFDFDTGSYLADYEEALCGDLPSLYHVEDSWRSYDTLAPILDKRFASGGRGATEVYWYS
jgi:hypothetical protein